MSRARRKARRSRSICRAACRWFGETAEKTVEPPNKKAGYSQVSWRVKAGEVGEYEVKVKSGGVTARDKVKIKIGGVFGSD